MKKLFVSAVVLGALALFPATAAADWFENFDSYAAGSQIIGQGGWEGWDLSPTAGALVSNLYGKSPANSVEIVGPTDLVHTYTGYTSGTWEYTSWMYIPSGFSGQSYYIMLSTYAHGGTKTWAMQPYFDSLSGRFFGYMGAPTAFVGPAYVTDAWAELKLIVDLDLDWAQFYYNGKLVDNPNVGDHPQLGGGWKWSGGWSGGATHPKEIACVDLYANGATAVYYDDMSLHPASLAVDTYTIKETTGGKANFKLHATAAKANRLYLMLGSVTGTSPGTPLKGGTTLPLNWDFFTSLVINLLNTPVFANFQGQLDATGSAQATFDTFGPVSGATGLIIHFAYTLANPFDFVSRPVPVQIVP